MRYIIGDIGNTTTKISILNKEYKIIKFYDFETKNIKKNNFLKIIIGNNKNFNKTILFSSVVPAAFKEIKKKLKNTKYKLAEIKNFDLKKLIRINGGISNDQRRTQRVEKMS